MTVDPGREPADTAAGAAAARPRQPTPTPSAAWTARATCRRRSDPDLVDAGHRGQGRARRPGLRARPPLPARRGHPVRRRDRRLVQAGPRGRGPARGGVHRLLRRALHGRERRHPHLGRRSRWSCPTWPPAARWPTWPRFDQVEEAWDVLADAGVADATVPVTYMNSSADIKGFIGRNGGVVCTSSNAAPGAGLGLRAAASEGALPARPAPRPQHRGARAGPRRSTTACSTTRTSPAAG